MSILLHILIPKMELLNTVFEFNSFGLLKWMIIMGVCFTIILIEEAIKLARV